MAHQRALQQLQDVLRFLEQAKGGPASNALIIDGKALTHALAPDVKHLFLQVCIGIGMLRVEHQHHSMSQGCSTLVQRCTAIACFHQRMVLPGA